MAYLLVLPALLVALSWPLLFTTSGMGGDWEHHLWFIWHQTLSIRADGAPSPFLNTRSSVLYPIFEFYGGTIYAITGTLAVVLGDSPIGAYIATYLLGFSCAYGGWYWLARMAGLGRWMAQVPGLLFVTTAYYLTLVYGQGDWPEFIALSMLPLMLAAGLAVLRTERLQILHATALAGSTIVFFGSHILTVLWGTTLLLLVSIAIVAAVPEWRRYLTRGRVLRLLAITLPAGLVNAWFLVPMTAYSSHTQIGREYALWYEDLHATMHLVAFSHLFAVSRASAIPAPDWVLSLPTVTILWVVVSFWLLLVIAHHTPWVRLLSILVTATAVVVILMTHAGLLLALPKPFTLLQFSYRLEAYVLMTVTAAVLVVLAVLRSMPTPVRLWAWTIVPVLLFSLGGGVEQVDAYPRTPQSREAIFTTRFEQYAELYKDYAYLPLPVISEQGLRKLTIPLSAIHDNRASISTRAPRGSLVASNIEGGPDLVKITGASIVADDLSGHLVLAIGGDGYTGDGGPHASDSIDRISVEPSEPAPVIIGQLLALAALLMLVVGLVVLLIRRLALRRRSLPRSWRRRTIRYEAP